MNEFTEVNGLANPFTADDGVYLIKNLTDAQRQTVFCSFKPTTLEEKAQLFSIMNNPEKRLGDCINTEIRVKDLFCEVVELTNKETGELSKCPRIVVIDEDNVGYSCVSFGVWNAFKKLISIYGAPTWATPIPLVVRQINKGDRKILTFDIVQKKNGKK